MSDLSRWLDDSGLAVDALDERRVEEFLQALEPQRRRLGDAAAGRQLLAHLGQNGRGPAATPAPVPEGQIQRVYERFLVNERGVSGSTARGYVSLAGTFLAERFGSERVELESLSAHDANQFILHHAQRWSYARCKQAATALPGFLRRLYQPGDIPADLAGAVLPVRDWRLSEPSKSLPAEQVESILSGCDRTTVAGRRDHAILLLLVRLGLRGGEVVALTLDDLDWNEAVPRWVLSCLDPEPSFAIRCANGKSPGIDSSAVPLLFGCVQRLGRWQLLGDRHGLSHCVRP